MIAYGPVSSTVLCDLLLHQNLEMLLLAYPDCAGMSVVVIVR